MLETLAAVLTALLLGGVAPGSADVTMTSYRDGDTVHTQVNVLVDGQSYAAPWVTNTCASEVREPLCDLVGTAEGSRQVHSTVTRENDALVVRVQHSGDTIGSGEGRWVFPCNGPVSTALCDLVSPE